MQPMAIYLYFLRHFANPGVESPQALAFFDHWSYWSKTQERRLRGAALVVCHRRLATSAVAAATADVPTATAAEVATSA
jgi:hypothetical protein